MTSADIAKARANPGLHHSAKLSNADVARVRRWRADGVPLAECVKRLGNRVTVGTVSRIGRGTRRATA